MPARVPLRTLLFDLDGTIADTHGLILKCYDYAIRQHVGLPGVRAVWEARIGLPLDDILCATFAHYGRSLPSPAELDAIKQTYRAHMRDSDSDISAFEGIPETLHSLKAEGFKLAVVTTKHQAMALRHLEILSLLPIFGKDGVICGDMCPACKPAPEPLWMALDVLGSVPQEAAMIGDSRQDILGAQAAGVLAVAACWGTDNREALLAAAPDFVAETPYEILKLQ